MSKLRYRDLAHNEKALLAHTGFKPNEADCLPERQGERLARAVAEHKCLQLDGTERPIARSTDYETQKEHYSGKKTPYGEEPCRLHAREAYPLLE